MSDQFLGEIRIFGFNFAPLGWAQCNGSILPISQYAAVFSLVGTYYGGNGTSNFGLPNLQGNLAIDQGQGAGLSSYFIGASGGSQYVTLLLNEIPQHVHPIYASATGNEANPTNATFGGAARGHTGAYAAAGTNVVSMSPGAVTTTGGGQPHDNMPPYLVMNFCIALSGIFPTRG
jgi:microcystin-dependent protein